MLRIPNKQELLAIRLAHNLSVIKCSQMVGVFYLTWVNWEAETCVNSIDASAWHLFLIRLSGYKQYKQLTSIPSNEEIIERLRELGLSKAQAGKSIGFSISYINQILLDTDYSSKNRMTVRAWQLLHLLNDKKIKIKYKDVYDSLEVKNGFQSLAIYPQESLYGYLGRLVSQNGLQNLRELRKALSSKHSSACNELLELIALELKMDFDELCLNHANFGIKRFTEVNQDRMIGDSDTKLKFIYLPQRPKLFYFCEDCIKEDLLLHKTSYWRATHQTYGVDWCHQHGTRITVAWAGNSGQDNYRFTPNDVYDDKTYLASKKDESHLTNVLIGRYYQLIHLFSCITLKELYIGNGVIRGDARRQLSEKGILLKTSHVVIGGQSINEVFNRFYPAAWLKRLGLCTDNELSDPAHPWLEYKSSNAIPNILLLNIMYDNPIDAIVYAARLLHSEINYEKLCTLSKQIGITLTEKDKQQVNLRSVPVEDLYTLEDLDKDIVNDTESLSAINRAQNYENHRTFVQGMKQKSAINEAIKPIRDEVAVWSEDVVRQLGKKSDRELAVLLDVDEEAVTTKRISLNIRDYENGQAEFNLESFFEHQALIEFFKKYHDDEISALFVIPEDTIKELRNKLRVVCDAPGYQISTIGPRDKINLLFKLRSEEISKLLSLGVDIKRIALIFHVAISTVINVKRKEMDLLRLSEIESKTKPAPTAPLVKLEDLGINQKLINVLKLNDVRTVDELLQNTPRMLEKFINLSRRGIVEIKEALLKNNLSLPTGK